jgi:hypothetical protein
LIKTTLLSELTKFFFKKSRIGVRTTKESLMKSNAAKLKIIKKDIAITKENISDIKLEIECLVEELPALRKELKREEKDLIELNKKLNRAMTF